FDIRELDKIIDKEISEILDFHAEPVTKKIKLKVGERRDAAVLFLDIKGFTAMSGQLDVEDVVDTLKPIFSAFTKVIKKYQGSIDKYEGDAIMAVFGGKKATENDVENAIRAGLEMQYMLPIFNRKYTPLVNSGLEIKMRIGIHFGEVMVTEVGIEESVDETVYGTSVNIAARLEPVCPLGKILVTRAIKDMVEHIFLCSLFETRSLKGIDEPVELWIIEGIKPGYIERWNREDIFKDSHFVGRKKELEMLKKNFIKSEGKYFFVIKAPAGMGKSRLANEFSRNQVDTFCLKGRCASYFPPSLYIVKDLIMNFITENRKKSLSLDLFNEKMNKLFSDDLDQLKLTVPLLGSIIDLEIDDDRLNLEPKLLFEEKKSAFFVFIKQLINVAQTKPVIVFDDLQWIDQQSQEFLDFVINNLSFGKAFMMILLSREYFQIPFKIAEDKNIEFLLKPLKKSDLEYIVKTVLKGVDIKERNIQKVIEASGGTPFYIEEFIRLLIMKDIIIRAENGFKLVDRSVVLEPPVSLKSLILSRIDFLRPELKKTVKTASVIGRSFFFRHLDTMAGKLDQFSSTDIKKNVKSIEKLKYLLESTNINELEYMFRDILTWETVYKTILFANRKVLHRIAAEIYESTGESANDPDLTAYHYFHSDRKKRAISWLKIGLEKNIQLYAIKKALEQINMLEELAETSNDLIQKKISVLITLGKYTEAEKSLEQIDLDAEKSYLHGRILAARSSFEDAAQMYETSYNQFSNEDDVKGMLKAIRAKGTALYELRRMEQTVESFLKSLELSLQIDSKLDIGRAYNDLGICAEFNADYQMADTNYKNALENENEDKMLHSNIVGNLGNLYFKQDKLEIAENYYKVQLKQVQEIPYREGIVKAAGNLAVSLEYQGKDDEAKKYFELSKKLASDIGDKLGVSFALTNLADLNKYNGNLDESQQNSNQAKELCLEIKDHEGYIQSLGNLGDIFLIQSNWREAEKNYQKAVDYAITNKLEETFIMPAIYLGLTQVSLKLKKKVDSIRWRKCTFDVSTKVGRDDILQALSSLSEQNT
ncbi:MAG: tetratricopeptide repeat protein, partial [Candidatus Heimdallarchaeota archaeon]